MVEFHVVTDGNRHLYEDVMDAHYRLRKTLYIDRSGWRALQADALGREIDQFDNACTTYLFGLDEAGALVSGSRLHPSTEPTLMSDVFPQLAAVRGLQRAPDVYEWTRVFTDPAKRTEGKSSTAAGEIYCAVIQYCLDEGILGLNIVTETFYIPRYLGLGWRLKMLGEVLEHDGLSIVGVHLPIDDETIAATQRTYGIGPTVFASRVNRRQDRPEQVTPPLVV